MTDVATVSQQRKIILIKKSHLYLNNHLSMDLVGLQDALECTIKPHTLSQRAVRNSFRYFLLRDFFRTNIYPPVWQTFFFLPAYIIKFILT